MLPLPMNLATVIRYFLQKLILVSFQSLKNGKKVEDDFIYSSNIKKL